MNILQNLISDELIYALGWTMVHSLWQGILIAFLMYAALFFLQKKSAKIRYEVATISLFALFIVSLCTFLLLMDNTTHTPLEVILLNVSNPSPPLSVSIWESYQSTATHYFNQQLPLLVTLWLLGVAFFVLRLIGGLVFIQKLKHQQNTPLNIHWQQKLQNFLSDLPLLRKVHIRESALINVPMVVGYFKPMILLPVGVINHLSSQEVEAIIAHELAHVFRNDYVINIILSFIEVLFYYHPAVWVIAANIREERENCADDLAIEWCGSSMTYAKALVSLEALNPSVPVFAMPLSRSKNQLMQRVKRILDQPQQGSDILEKLSATGLVLMAILCLSFSSEKTSDKIMDHPLETITKNYRAFPDPITSKIKATVHYEHSSNHPTDSIPIKRKRIQTIRQSDENQSIEIEIDGTDITRLEVDGKVIPEEEYENYESEIARLRESVPPTPPAPPTPPTPPMPPMPPAPTISKEQKVKIIAPKEGSTKQTIIIIDGDDDPMEIAIDEDNMIYVDGQNIEFGDSLIIVEQSTHSPSQFLHNDFPRLNDPAFDLNRGWPEIFEKEWKDIKHTLPFFSREQQEELEHSIEELYHLEQERVEEFSSLAEEYRLQAEEKREEAMAKVEEYLNQMEAQRAELMEKAEEARAEALHRNENFILHQYQNERHQGLVDQLIKDGLIKNKEKYSIRFNNKKLKVNGKQVPEEIYKKYYQKFGDKNFNIHIEKR